ncbi:MAG: putative Ig domain-containing protein, partial [Thermoanaerobaculia bacterium]
MNRFSSLLASLLVTAAALVSAPPASAACPTILVNPVSLPDGYSGIPYVGNSVTQTGGTTVTFSITSGVLPTGLSMDGAGSITGTPTANGTYVFTATATDSAVASAGCTGGRTFALKVNSCPTINVSNPVNTNGAAGTAFTETFTQTGGNGTITWSKTGTLPTGITLNSATGVLSGTTTQTGPFPIVVTATDANGCTGAGATYNLSIGCPTITVTNPVVTTGTVSSAFSQTFTQSGAVGGATFTLNSGTLPSGVTLSAAGLLSGTPTQSGSFPITVLVTDGNGCT